MNGVFELKRRLVELLGKAGALEILYDLLDGERRFKDFEGPTETKTKRLHELREAGLIEPVFKNPAKKERLVFHYALTEKGRKLVEGLESLLSRMN